MEFNSSLIRSVLTIYEELLANGISLVYLGEFRQEITEMFAAMSEKEMERIDEDKSTRRKVYHSLVETLQNMNKHSDQITDKYHFKKGFFVIGKKDFTYYIITINKIEQSRVPELKNALDEVNSLTKAELKQRYKKQLVEGHLSEKSGAGLGLIDLARKSDGKLQYQFLALDEKYFLFMLKVEVMSKTNIL